MNDATKLNRQQRRRAERHAERLARKADTIERRTGAVLVDPAELEMLRGMLRYFVAIVKEQGRVRVSNATLDGLTPLDSVRRANAGDAVMLTFETATPTEARGPA